MVLSLGALPWFLLALASDSFLHFFLFGLGKGMKICLAAKGGKFGILLRVSSTDLAIDKMEF